MFQEVILWILGVGGLITIVILLLTSFARLRDEVVSQGWVTRDGRLGRMTQRGETNRAISLLQAVGLDAQASDAIREAAPPVRRRQRLAASLGLKRPDLAFLEAAREWIYELDPAYDYKGSPFYLDIMGAIDGREQAGLSIAQIFDTWVTRLRHEGVVDHFDAMLAPKDGNVLLCKALASRLDVPLFLCKGDKDKAKVGRPGVAPHETDFEGLRAFFEAEGRKARLPGRKFHVLVVDDSCSNGSQINSAIRRFNQFNNERPATSIRFETVKSVAVLFRVLTDGVKNDAFNANLVNLHALVAVGEVEMKSLRAGVPKLSKMDSFKNDPFACEVSKRIYSAEKTSGKADPETRAVDPASQPAEETASAL